MNKDSSGRHYLGLWTWDLDGKLDFLACAWRENGAWVGRARFRYYVDPAHESRFEAPQATLRDLTEDQAHAHMSSLAKLSNLAGVPIRYIPINGGPSIAKNVIFREQVLLGRAMDDPAMRVLYDPEKPFPFHGEEYKQYIAKHGKLEPAEPGQFGFWTLGIIGC